MRHLPDGEIAVQVQWECPARTRASSHAISSSTAYHLLQSSVLSNHNTSAEYGNGPIGLKDSELTDNTQPIPDQSHINKVRDALSIRPISRASVMVGSGFSRNAQKTRFDAPDMPLWTDIAKELFKQLYPESADDDSYGPEVVAPSVDNVLRLAQEYETAFGRSDLYMTSRPAHSIYRVYTRRGACTAVETALA